MRRGRLRKPDKQVRPLLLGAAARQGRKPAWAGWQRLDRAAQAQPEQRARQAQAVLLAAAKVAKAQ